MILDEDSRIKTKILNAIVEDPEIVLLLKEKYVDDEIWKFCIERDPNIFKKMKRPSEDICMYACDVDGSNLKYIKNKFKHVPITMTMCFTAVQSNAKAILSVPTKFLNDELKEMAFDQDPSLMQYFNDIRKEYLERLILEKPYALKYTNVVDEELLCDTIRKSPNICPYLNTMTQKMVETLQQCHPEYYNLYKNSITIADGENIVRSL